MTPNIRLQSRSMSTTAAKVVEEEEPIQGSAPVYKRHILICTGTPSKEWPKKPEMSDPYLNLLTTQVRGQEVKVNLTDVASSDISSRDSSSLPPLLPSKGPRHDLVLFPDNVKFNGIRYEAFNDLSRYLAQHPIGTLRPTLEKLISEKGSSSEDSDSIHTELVPGNGELVSIELVSQPSAVLVCVHGSRDCRCGDQGGAFYQILNDMIQATGLTNSIKTYGVSHIGGHKWAPNTIMYPSGDWHGNLSELDSVDAQQILFEALGSGGIAAGVREKKVAHPIMIEKWRGRIGLNQKEQLELWEEVLEKQKLKMKAVTQPSDQKQSLFSAPGDELYDESEMKQQPQQPQQQQQQQQQEIAPSQDDPKPETQNTGVAPNLESANVQRVKIVFETFQKVRTEIDAKVGERIFDIVKDKDPSRHGVYQALECTCGGQLECATCHVYIEPPYYARLPSVSDAEEDMLEYAVGRKESSRLGCQIKIQPEMEGMTIKLPQY
ncbi:hypothetical protein BGZ76_007596 [Entomortierella beljakovae]|nr:hypothetical protein BGZ76_007596 [Entomortierella beljakovae]